MKKTIYFIMIFFSVLFLGIGYATISNISLEIDGDASLEGQNNIYISSMTLDSTTHATASSQIINTYYQTMINTRTVLGEESDSQVTYEITIHNASDKTKVFQGVAFDSEFYSNNEITYTLSNLSVGDEVESGDDITFQITFHYADTTHTNNSLDSVLSFDFEDYHDPEDFEMTGSCVFHGQNEDVTGDCVGPDEHVDYLNKGIALFSQENVGRDFVLEVELGAIEDSRFRNSKVDTIVSNMLEDESTWPGFVFRIENSQWYFQAGYGNNKVKLYFPKGSINTFKIIRDNGIIYYQINDNPIEFAADMSSFTAYFDAPLTFGTAIYWNAPGHQNGSPRTERYFIGELTHFRFAFEEQDIHLRDYSIVDQEIEDFINQPLVTAFSSPGSHTFDGTADTGLHTNVPLFSTTNYVKDWVCTFEIDSYTNNTQSKQATMFNAKDESGNGYPGVVLRRNGTNLEINVKDGEGGSNSANIPPTAKRINIIKKGSSFYYQYDLGYITDFGSMAAFNPNKCFNTETTFGSNINGNGDFDRVIVGTLSNMTIKMTQ